MLSKKNSLKRSLIWILLISVFFSNILALNVNADTTETSSESTSSPGTPEEITEAAEAEATTETVPETSETSAENEEVAETAEPEVTIETVPETNETSAENEEVAETAEPEVTTETVPETNETSAENEEVAETAEPEVTTETVQETSETSSENEEVVETAEPEVTTETVSETNETSVESEEAAETRETETTKPINEQNPETEISETKSPDQTPAGSEDTDITISARSNDSDFIIDVSSHGTATIKKYIGTERNVDIPYSIQGYVIERIGQEAFAYKKLLSVTIPSGVKIIEEGAFGHNNLSEITFSSNLTSLGERAFSYNNLRLVTIPSNITILSKCVFYNNQLTSVTIPSNIKTIGHWAFADNNLTSIVIPDSVHTLGKGAFQNNKLKSVTFSSNIKALPEAIFENNQLTQVTIPANVKSIGYSAFAMNKLTNVTIPSSVTSIDGQAFLDNQLTSVKLPNGITTIGDSTFNLNKLTSIEIPDTVTSIGWWAFNNNQLSSVTIPSSVSTIGREAFKNNQLKSVKMSYGLTELGACAFENNQLTGVFIPFSVEFIGFGAFWENKISYAYIPDTINMLELCFPIPVDEELGVFDDFVYDPTIDQVLDECFDNGVINLVPTDNPLPAVANLKASVNQNKITLSWDEMPIASGYIITRKAQGETEWNFSYTNEGATTFVDTVNKNGNYQYQVRPYHFYNVDRITGQSSNIITASVTSFKVTRYILANSNLRSAPNGSIITKLKMPLFVTGTILGTWLKFTYNGKTAYVATSLTTTKNPALTGYAKSAVNVRTGPGGSVLGTIPKGRQVQGVLVGKMVRFAYKGRTGYVYASLLQATPVRVTKYIVANSIIRSAPNGSIIARPWRPYLVSGTIHGAWLRFTYNGKTAYVAMSSTTYSNPPVSGYAKQTLKIRNTPTGAVTGTLARGRQVQGVLVGNMVKFTHNGKTSYVYAILLQGTPVKVTKYIVANSIIRSSPNGSIIARPWRPYRVTGTIRGAWLRFTYKGKVAYIAMGSTTYKNPPISGIAKQTLNIRNTPAGNIVATIPAGTRVSGILTVNMVKFNYAAGKTGYVYASLLR
ncbi:MAG: leucine-rich repeat protein [Saccharofermentanales bacterium]